MGGAWSGRLGSNDVWSSSNGRDWVMATANAGWAARAGHSSAALVLLAAETYRRDSRAADSESVLVVAGGSGGWGVRQDVWWSVDGVTWLLRTAAAGWTGRLDHGMAVAPNASGGARLWVAGGSDGLHLVADVWWSDDGGTSWVEATAAAAWGRRAGHSLVACGGALMLVGGRVWDSFGLTYESGDQAYDGLPDEVWASGDGAAWAMRGGGFGGRDLVRGACIEGRRVWVVGGFAAEGARNDIWASS